MTPLMAKCKCIVFLFLSALLVFSNSFAAEPEPGIVDVQEKIQKIEDNIKFEKGWDEKLSKAKDNLKNIKLANTTVGAAIRFLVDAYENGESEAAIKEKLKDANILLAPYFKVDGKGNLQWGAALEMIGIQRQFIPGDMTALTPEGAESIVNEFQQKNKAAKAENETELGKLKIELKQLQDEEAKKQTESQNTLKDAQKQLKALIDKLNEKIAVIRGLEKLKEKYDETELELKFNLATIQKAENEAEKGNRTWTAVIADMELISKYRSEIREKNAALKEKTAELEKRNSSKIASRAVAKICDYSARTSSEPLPSADEVSSWKNESERLISEAAASLKLVNSINSIISELNRSIKGLDSVDRDALHKMLDQLIKIKRDGNLDNAGKSIPRVEKLRNTLKLALTISNDQTQKLDSSVWQIKLAAETLEKTIRGKDKKLQEEINPFLFQINDTYTEVQNIIKKQSSY